jgi:O-acetyl-ADP-ribose deacetylase (regulator of RNase III)
MAFDWTEDSQRQPTLVMQGRVCACGDAVRGVACSYMFACTVGTVAILVAEHTYARHVTHASLQALCCEHESSSLPIETLQALFAPTASQTNHPLLLFFVALLSPSCRLHGVPPQPCRQQLSRLLG